MTSLLQKNGLNVNTSSVKNALFNANSVNNALFTPISNIKMHRGALVGERLTLTKKKTEAVKTINKDESIQITRQLITKEIPWAERKQQNMMIADIIEELAIKRPLESNLHNRDDYNEHMIDDSLIDDAQKLRDCASVLSLETYHGKVLDKTGRSTGKTATKQYAEAMNSCGKRYCPVCTWRTSVNKGAELYKFLGELLDERKEQRDQYRFAFMTFTIPNCKGEELDVKLDKMLKAFPKMLKDPSLKFKKDGKSRFKVVGSYKAVEVTYNANRDDYHPHIHAIVILDPNTSTKDLIGNIYSNNRDKTKDRASQKLWCNLWEKYVEEKCDYNALDIRPLDRVLKTQPDGRRMISKLEFKDYRKKILSACAELTKYTWKFSDFIALGEETYQGNYSHDTGLKLKRHPKTGELERIPTGYPARGKAGEKKPVHILNQDRQKLRNAMYWILSATYNRQLHSYYGVLRDYKQKYTNELEDLREKCKNKEIPASVVKEFQGKDRMIDSIDGQMVIRTNELDESGICRIMCLKLTSANIEYNSFKENSINDYEKTSELEEVNKMTNIMNKRFGNGYINEDELSSSESMDSEEDNNESDSYSKDYIPNWQLSIEELFIKYDVTKWRGRVMLNRELARRKNSLMDCSVMCDSEIPF